jgi:hypothetical protein
VLREKVATRLLRKFAPIVSNCADGWPWNSPLGVSPSLAFSRSALGKRIHQNQYSRLQSLTGCSRRWHPRDAIRAITAADFDGRTCVEFTASRTDTPLRRA